MRTSAVWDDDRDAPPGPLYATHSAEHPDPRGIPCPEPAEDDSAGYRGGTDVDLNYVDKIVARLEELLDDCDEDLLRYYALLALVLGEAVTERDVHDAWSVWRTATKPDHPSLLPFNELPREVQDLDTKYAEGIRLAVMD